MEQSGQIYKTFQEVSPEIMTNMCDGCGGHKDQWMDLCNECVNDKETITKTVKYMNKVLAKLDKAIEESEK